MLLVRQQCFKVFLGMVVCCLLHLGSTCTVRYIPNFHKWIIVDYKYGHGANSLQVLVERSFPGTFGSGARCLQARKYRVHMADGRGPCMIRTECEECRNSAKDLPRRSKGFRQPGTSERLRRMDC